MADQKLSALVELAAKPAADDELYIRDVSEAAADESKRIKITNLLTKEFFVPATGYENGAGVSVYGRFAAQRLDDVNERAMTSFAIPSDFHSIVEAVLVVIPNVTHAAAEWSIHSSYGAVGENYSTHAETDNVTTYNVTNAQTFEVDISGILTALAADDYVGIMFQQGAAGHNVSVVGVRFKYN